MREKIIESVENNKLVVIVRGVAREKLIPLAEAMYKGGVRLLEITYSADGSTSDEETADRIKMLVEHFQGRMFIGAGTVLNKKQVELTKKAGGGFIISPDTNTEVIKETVRLGLVSMPGALTPTEVQTAHLAGADFVKLFPAGNLGAEYVKALRAPLSHVKMLAVGGINLDNMQDYLKVGISGFGIGSNITPKKCIEEGNYAEITELSKKYVAAVK
jgi:2-dehydro-3-deoxyphosphogluconate aldolase/(4S)-4-hydroxy-2-oxoglutarate aldolase